MDAGSLRQDYAGRAPLRRVDLNADPIRQFDDWFQQACAAEQPEANAMVLSTAGDGPSQRTVLLKLFDDRGFVFFTNNSSHKAGEIERDNRVSLLFPWYVLQRQVIVSGEAEMVSQSESLTYFATRPRGSQLGAWSSRQSSVVGSRSLLEAKLAEIKRKFANGEVPLPSFWGGYRVVPRRIEFWQGQPDRMHDRFLYRRQADNDWLIERLAP